MMLSGVGSQNLLRGVTLVCNRFYEHIMQQHIQEKL